MKTNKIPWSALAAFFLLLSSLSPPVSGRETQDPLGNYELQGVMEMAGMLALKPGGKYAAGFTYGAADWMEVGAWKAEGDDIVLSGGRFQAKNADLPLFLPSGTRLRFQEGRLT